MVSYLRAHAGFSWIGLVYLALLFIPNILWARTSSDAFRTLEAAEPSWLVLLERIGQVLACITVLFTRMPPIRPGSAAMWWLVAATVLMALYELFWIRYFRSAGSLQAFYAPFLGVPVPGALFPVAALLCLAGCAQSPLILIAACILGVGHIGIHALHALSVLP